VTPTLHTERLTLRAHRLSDFEAFANLFATDRSTFMDGPLERWQVWDRFAAETGGWALVGCGSWAVVLTDGATIGQVGISKPDYFPEHELGWLLYDGYEHQGYATEAARAAMHWAFGPFGLTTLVSYIDPPNGASIRVAERLGGRPDATAARPSPGDLVYRYEVAA
jgi:RimJ/RimL family protein N-acetyltransferase